MREKRFDMRSGYYWYYNMLARDKLKSLEKCFALFISTKTPSAKAQISTHGSQAGWAIVIREEG